MDITENDVKRMALIFLVLGLAILVFLILNPVILSVLAGLILAFIFLPVYRWFLRYMKNKSLTAALVSFLMLVIIFVPLWFLVPLMFEQVFEFFQFTQNLDTQGFITRVFPTASSQLIAQITVTINSAITKISSSVLNSLVELIIDFPTIALHLVLVAFVFFFTLRDEERLREFVSGLSPLNKTQEKTLIKQFKDITQSIVYGQIIIGLIQGILAGIGFLAFGVPNALILTVLATMLSILPVIGPGLVYIPIGIYMLVSGDTPTAVLFLLYNFLLVSTIDNVLRTYFITRKTKMSEAIGLIGMIGGLFVFGILGIILGPLILAYFVTFLEAYKEKRLSSLFSED